MSLPVTVHQTPDVIEGRASEAGTRWRVPLMLVSGGVAVLLGGALAIIAAQEARGSQVVDASGTMVVEHHSSETARRPHSVLWEAKNASFSGPIRVELPDRHLTGTTRLSFSFAAQMDGDELRLFHNWGQVFATFGKTNCEGSFAMSFYREPHEAGGSLSLRCDDGSLLAATARVEKDEDPTADRPYRMFISLEDGAYVAGPDPRAGWGWPPS
jgi:hypothetical protein